MSKKENPTMRIFAALGITIVVAGHLQANFLNMGGLFSYYAFHAYFFVFVAGFFYNPKNEENIIKFIIKKAKSLLFPYFFINLFYGLLSTFLISKGIYVGGSISLYNLFIAPFLGGHQFMFNSPAWYVPALFVIEIIYCISRKMISIVLRKMNVSDKNILVINDVVTQVVYLLLAMLTICLSMQGKTWGIYKTIGRWLLMLPGICFGRSYSTYGRKWAAAFVSLIKRRIDQDARLSEAKKLSTFKLSGIGLYAAFFALLFLIQYLVVSNTEYGLNYSVVWATSYANGPIIPFITTFTGLALWYGISSVLAKTPLAKILSIVGKSSNSIMSHHYLVVFVINLICYGVLMSSSNVQTFDYASFSTDVTYQYMYAPFGMTANINTIICVTILTLVSVCAGKLKKNLK